MRFRGTLFSAALTALFVLAAPLRAFTLLESEQKVPVLRGDTFRTHFHLAQAALCDGSVKLKPGEYDVQILSMGDGSVRATFFDKSGRKAGEARGIIAVLRKAQAGAPGAAHAETQKVQASSAHKVAPAASEQLSLNFSKIGFGPESKSSVHPQGQKLDLEIVAGDGGHAILIGLLVPAVQKVRGAPAKK
jgi:hypothetical protein